MRAEYCDHEYDSYCPDCGLAAEEGEDITCARCKDTFPEIISNSIGHWDYYERRATGHGERIICSDCVTAFEREVLYHVENAGYFEIDELEASERSGILALVNETLYTN
jgi:hypothetical protein